MTEPFNKSDFHGRYQGPDLGENLHRDGAL